MRYPNLRYGNPEELRHWSQCMPLKELAKSLRRDERTVRDWLSGRKKMPFWVPELVMLRKLQHDEMLRQMRLKPVSISLGLVRGQVIEMRPAKQKPQAAMSVPGAFISLRRSA